jgi:hypothetical protein
MPIGLVNGVSFIDNLDNEDETSAAKQTAAFLLNPSISEYDLEDLGILNSAQMTERGKNYMIFSEETDSPNGFFVTAPEWTLDSETNTYKPFVIHEESSLDKAGGHIVITSARIGAEILQNSIQFFDPNLNELLAIETFELQYRCEKKIWHTIETAFEQSTTFEEGDYKYSIVRFYDTAYPLFGKSNFKITVTISPSSLKHTLEIENTGDQTYEFRVLQHWKDMPYGDFMQPELGERIFSPGKEGMFFENVGPVIFFDGDRQVISEDPTDDSNPVMFRSENKKDIWVEDGFVITENESMIPTGHYETITEIFEEPSPFMEFYTSASLEIRKTEFLNYRASFIYTNPYNFTVDSGATFTLDPMTSTYNPYDTNQNGWIYMRDDGYKAYNKGYYGSTYFPFGYYDPQSGETGPEYYYRSFEQFDVQGLPNDADVKSVVLATYMQATTADNDINTQRLGILREVTNDWGSFNTQDWGQAIDTSWALTINHGEPEYTSTGEFRRWASWWDWEGGGLCNLVESKRASSYVRLRYSHTDDAYAQSPAPQDFDKFTKEAYRHRNGGNDPSHPNVLIVSYSSSSWDYTYDGTTKYPSNQPYWLAFPREVFGWGTDNVYSGEIGVSGTIYEKFDVLEWGDNPGGDVKWGPHIILPWTNKVSLDTSFKVSGDIWFNNYGSGAGGSKLTLWDTNHKRMALLYIFDIWAGTTTYGVGAEVYDTNGQSIRWVYLIPQTTAHVVFNDDPWYIRSDGNSMFMSINNGYDTYIGSISEMGGETREVGFFSYQIWRRGTYGVISDPGGIDDIQFKTPHNVYMDVKFMWDQKVVDYSWDYLDEFTAEEWIPYFMEGLNDFYQQYWANVRFYHKDSDSDWEVFDSNGPNGAWSDISEFMYEWAITEHGWPEPADHYDENDWTTQGTALPSGEGHGDYFDFLVLLTAQRWIGYAGAAWRRSNVILIQVDLTLIFGYSHQTIPGTHSIVAHEAGHCFGVAGDTWGTRLDVMDWYWGLYYPWSSVFDSGHQEFVAQHIGKHSA